MGKRSLPNGGTRTEVGGNRTIRASAINARQGAVEIIPEEPILTVPATVLQSRIIALGRERGTPVYVPECGPSRILIMWRNESTAASITGEFAELLGAEVISSGRSKRHSASKKRTKNRSAVATR